MNKKTFYIEYKSLDTGKIYRTKEDANYILGNETAYPNVDYTLDLEAYVEFLSDGRAELVYWELNSSNMDGEFMIINMRGLKKGTLTIDSNELGCTFNILKGEKSYYIEEIAEWVLEEYPVAAALRVLEVRNRKPNNEIEQIVFRIYKEEESEYYDLDEKFSITRVF